MKREGAAALVTFIVTFTLVPLIRHLCRDWKILDHPGALKIHAKPVPRLGGVAIFLGVLAGIFMSSPRNFTAHWQFSAAIFVIWVAGLVDDLRGLPPAWRLGAQILSAVLLWQGGWHIPFDVTAPIQILMCCVLVILFANSFNFLDGSDGLTTGVSLVIALSYLVMPRTALTPFGFSTALCIAAACLAFLPFNRYPASMFLGDSGATLLGFLAAFIGLDFANTTTAPEYSALALTIAALPIFDALRVVAKRMARGASPLSGDRNHFYDALLAKGWRPQRVATVSWMITALCGAVAVCIARLHASVAWCLVAFVVVAGWIKLANSSHRDALRGNCEAGAADSDCVFVGRSEDSGPGPQEGEGF